ncbi:unnamed protein product (macronuclear) [Paramecium tetraurelia]|uniref:Chromosome undetermined scaffold_47, whole genome shotgun sequence n=1 Tax=Paramecium tetraurelia TaxID=5888 RepID=Q3SD03_PARTE|nr:uncharacterized protein GSPATT00016098001 [Paramecium tetraurelia]CAI44562.1 rab_A44 [Paramecium tetraurelia]CAK81256.1 unnamed protein product [Paramecium tetraurelia]|eukprot:XP_001448653.1 hypothetical protein (macronuclear) [Paramecium tetraurelia strain d4-2]
MMEDEFSYLFKIILIGDSGVGKTNLFNRLQNKEFQYDTRPTIGVEFINRTVRQDGNLVKCQIWDTAGQEKFRAITNAYYRGAKGVFVCYDVTKQGTYESTLRWMSEIKQFGDHDIVIMLVGNKIDLAEQRIVRTDEVSQFCEQNKVGYIETSALNNINVEMAFNQMVTEIYKIVSAQKPISQTLLGINDVYVLRKETQPEQTKQKKQCC